MDPINILAVIILMVIAGVVVTSLLESIAGFFEFVSDHTPKGFLLLMFLLGLLGALIYFG